MTEPIYKYPRTQHIEGSGLQAGDDLAIAPWVELAGRYLVVEEKMDGANCGVSFDSAGNLRLQSRGHYLRGGPREFQFDLFKSWAWRYAAELRATLGDRYVLYGEWCYAKHSIFYTSLPHYFLEFDIFDSHTGRFLSTKRRRAMLHALPFVTSVEVLHAGELSSAAALRTLVGPSRFIAADHREQLRDAARAVGMDVSFALNETDPSGLMEGLYIKVEDEDYVLGRYKYVRRAFLQTVLDSGSHWLDRPLLPNRLCAGVNLW